MSKWQLLLNRKQSASTSIHRHVGYQVINRVKVIWEKWQRNDKLILKENSVHSDIFELYNLWLSYMMAINSSELYVDLQVDFTAQFEWYEILIKAFGDKCPNGMRAVVLKLNQNISNCSDSMSATTGVISLCVNAPAVIALFPTCKYYYYELPSPAMTDVHSRVPDPVRVYTREGESTVISARRLTSHITCGVDNTGIYRLLAYYIEHGLWVIGNVRVWPCESILLHYLLRHRYQECRNKYVLQKTVECWISIYS